ncbi:hypothetical protein M0811_00393 [Anaeramoeba ignava]|uniref:Uncharacterized protein n=1 Tax=Anaeramoeba ignava TaxID=1746090 RepID=A0A9Q0LQE9_ANAIG|nr:hypothetical protein M0811_00393 [Anaeramoeba ignava]
MSNSNFGIETNFEMNSFDEESLPLPFQSDLLLSSLDFLDYAFLDSHFHSILFTNLDRNYYSNFGNNFDFDLDSLSPFSINNDFPDFFQPINQPRIFTFELDKNSFFDSPMNDNSEYQEFFSIFPNFTTNEESKLFNSNPISFQQKEQKMDLKEEEQKMDLKEEQKMDSKEEQQTSTDLKEKIEELIQNRKKKRNQTKTTFRLQCFSQISPKEFVYIRRNKKRIQIGKNFSLKKHGMEIGDKIVITSKLINLETQITKRSVDLIKRSYRNAFKPKGFIISERYSRGDLIFEFEGKPKSKTERKPKRQTKRKPKSKTKRKSNNLT